MKVYVAHSHTHNAGTRFEGVFSNLALAERVIGFSDWRTKGKLNTRGDREWEGHGADCHYRVFEADVVGVEESS